MPGHIADVNCHLRDLWRHRLPACSLGVRVVDEKQEIYLEWPNAPEIEGKLDSPGNKNSSFVLISDMVVRHKPELLVFMKPCNSKNESHDNITLSHSSFWGWNTALCVSRCINILHWKIEAKSPEFHYGTVHAKCNVRTQQTAILAFPDNNGCCFHGYCSCLPYTPS